MPENKPRSSIGSTIATSCGIIVMCASMLVCAFNPKVSIAIAVIIGAILSAPMMVLGFRLDQSSSSDGDSARRFWPTQTEIWGILGLLTYFAYFLVPIGILGGAAVLLPPGDAWGVVVVRLVFVVLAGCGIYWWLKFASTTIANRFRGRLSDETLDAITRDKPTEAPQTAIAAAIKNWQLAVIAMVAFCVAFGVLDFDSPWLNIDARSKRFRGLASLIQWCRGNPNTVTSFSVLIGTGALAWYIIQICRAALNPEANPPDALHITKR